MARVAEAMMASRHRSVLPLSGVVLGVAGVFAVWSVDTSHSRGAGLQLFVLAGLAVVAGMWLSIVTPNPTGVLVVINPAVCFTFAIMLSWGVLPALAAHLAASSALIWRRQLSLARALVLIAQFAVAFGAGYGVLLLDGRRSDGGVEWISLHGAAIVVFAGSAWLAVYMSFSYLLARAGIQWLSVPPPTITGLLFNGALVLLSPAVAVTADRNLGLVALVLVPLYATQRMGRLTNERARADRMDPLTLLANRSTLREDFDRIAAASKDQPAAPRPVLVQLGLDRFKFINDSLGYETGDQLLVAVGTRLTDVHRGDTVARLGADQFTVLAHVPSAAVDDLAARTVDTFREPIRLDGILVDVSASVGLATRGPGDDFATVLRHADTAMNDAKRRGGGVAVYHGRPGEDSPERFALLADFRRALLERDTDQIAIYYQPQITLATGEIDALEALLRWSHPVHGPVDAMTIVGLAEQTPVMRLLTGLVIDTVTAQIADWGRDGLVLRVAVNISARDLYSENIVSQLGQRFAEHRLRPHQLQVEITETALMADPARALATLRRIADLGIDIALDDFGTGYSTLQNVRRMPLAEVKIDQTFVKGMTSDPEDAAIVGSTISLAHTLGLRTVAEGIEDDATRLALLERGCDLGQGWLISHAVPHDRVPTLIAERSGGNRPVG
jgi:diguanylate cyclase (GGDEF)-like protein